MGGFYYYNGDEPSHPVPRRDVEKLIASGNFKLPTKAEINDKSKGDPFSKALAILQALWFMMQCLACRIQHLTMTKLEIVTLAYTVINVAMYRFWWAKPLSMSRPFRVEMVPSISSDGNSSHASTPDSSTTPPPSVRFKLAQHFMKAVVGVQDNDVHLALEKQVPTFFSGKPEEHHILLADALALLVAVIFGAVHCIAWSFSFPSRTKKLLWRTSSVAIVGVPAIFIMLVLLIALDSKRLAKPVILLSMFGIPFYILARMVLLVLAFTTLRSLPLAAYESVHWTTFLPHF